MKKEKSCNELFNQKRIWIYGIGVIGKRICLMFNYFHISIEGILVSSMKNNIDRYLDIRVCEFGTTEIKQNDLIIVTATGKAQAEIIHNIESKEMEYVVWTPSMLSSLWKSCKYSFENRMQGKKKLCLVLSGYKEYLWDNVFQRLRENAPQDIEICLCSAGKYVKELSQIAKTNGWSYLYTEANSVSLIQNICISLYENAKWIYKMDEDMFVTKGSFENLISTANEILNSNKYELGVCSPLIPVNAIGYRLVLEKYRRLEDYEEQFGAAIIGGSPQREIEKNPETSKYMWGDSGLPQLDQLALEMQEESEYQICNTRLSIGFILFQRELWERMQGFVVYGNMDLGADEEDINAYCINNSRIMVVSLSAVVGHFGFGKQTNAMKLYYFDNPERF